MDIFSIAAGGAGVGLLWFLKLAGGKALPAVLAWIRARWSAGKPDLKSLLGDVGDAHLKIDRIKTTVTAEFAAVYAEIDEIKARLGLPIATEPPAAPLQPNAPAFLQGQS